MKTEITKQELLSLLQESYNKYKDEKGGKNANYIPYLSRIDSKLFGISACLPDGEILSVGDCNYPFGIESVSKVLTAILILKQYGAETIIHMIGADATGMPFNSIMAILLEKNHPSTPLVNAGAISAVSMVQPIGNSLQKWQAITDNIKELCGSEANLIEELYRSESVSNHNNKAIAWLLKSYNRIYDDPDLALDLYTRQCSLGITTKQLAICAATIANGGVNPITGKRIFNASLSPRIVSMMAAVGFYENTGDWMFRTGLPAKSGVGGGIMGVLPGTFGIAAFAPPLDSAGNSVKAQKALHYIMERLGCGVYNSHRITIKEKTSEYIHQ
ncbi:MAG: glutaminase A [Bacteroidaceae bacterium]|nr:glutaminase A [Bacteroidaceae bacterium]